MSRVLLGLLSHDSSTVLVGAVVGAVIGWVLGFSSDFLREHVAAKRARKTAALLIYAELTSNLAVVGALRKFGVWSTDRIHRSAWEAQAPALLYGADMNIVGHLVQAYNALEDVGFLVNEGGRDFTQGHDAEFLDDSLIPLIFAGMREVGPRAGVTAAAIAERIESSSRAMQ